MKELKSNCLVSVKCTFVTVIVLLFSWSKVSLAQSVNKDVKAEKIAENQKGHGHYTKYLKPNLKHPISSIWRSAIAE